LDTDYVKVVDYIPTIYVELKYGTTDNISGTVIYDFKNAYLRYGTVKKLMKVQTELNAMGYSMKIWDAYRPVEAQYKLWAAKPDARYIADPNKGYTSHSLGNTIDVTLVNADGSAIDMPTGFDNFTSKGDRDYSDVTPEQRGNALLLENIMKRYEFKPYSGEWWHFQDEQSYTYVDFKAK
jgi:D-alanyl-D-alanine dipeptidase